MYLWVSIGLFALFFGNVLMGATSGSTFLSDVGEMLLLAAASITFVAAILQAQRRAQESNSDQ